MNVDNRWIASTTSDQNALWCVQVFHERDGMTLVRDTTDTTRPPLRFGHEAWSAFITCMKAREPLSAAAAATIQRHRDGVTLMWHLHEPDGPVLAVSDPEWAAFIAGIDRGEFDRDNVSAAGEHHEPSAA